MSTDTPTKSVLAGLDAARNWQEDFYRLLHQEATGLRYSSTVTATNQDGDTVPVMHACGHDLHVTCLLGVASLLADVPAQWRGTIITLFQPAQEVGDGARGMVDDDLARVVGKADVALAQHVLPFPAGQVRCRPGPVFAASDGMRITVYGRGGHVSMPQAAVDAVVLAAMIVIRLQTVVSREVAPADPAVLTVASIASGTEGKVIADRAILQLAIRTYSEQTRSAILDAVRRIVTAECQASGCPKEPDFELFDRFPPTDNDAPTTDRVGAAFDEFFGDRAGDLALQTFSEDFSDIPNALGIPYCYWGIGGIDPNTYYAAEAVGRVAQDVPVNHSPFFAPVVQPTLDTGTQALTVAALAWLARPSGRAVDASAGAAQIPGRTPRGAATATGNVDDGKQSGRCGA